jgi:beta-galactosidase
MIMEQQGGLPGWNVFWGRQAAPGLYRAWSYQSVAHGADGICYFRWRTSRYGTEQYWQGVLDQDSYPNARYQIVAQTGKELGKLTELLQGSKVVSSVALLVSPDSRWAFRIQPLVNNFDYNRQLGLYYAAFRRLGFNVDVLFPQSDFTSYKIIVAPSLFVVDKPLAEKLAAFVKNGGTLVLSYRSGVKDEHNVVTDQPLPGPLAELAGVAIHDFDPQTNQEQEVVDVEGERYPARVWFDVLDPTTAEVLATYSKGYYAGKAAATLNRFGQGSVVYLGTEFSSPAAYSKLANFLAGQNGMAVGPSLPDGVEMAVREKAGKKILFLLNYTEKTQAVALDQAYQNALTGESEARDVQIPAFDVKVLTTP